MKEKFEELQRLVSSLLDGDSVLEDVEEALQEGIDTLEDITKCLQLSMDTKEYFHLDDVVHRLEYRRKLLLRIGFRDPALLFEEQERFANEHKRESDTVFIRFENPGGKAEFMEWLRGLKEGGEGYPFGNDFTTVELDKDNFSVRVSELWSG